MDSPFFLFLFLFPEYKIRSSLLRMIKKESEYGNYFYQWFLCCFLLNTTSIKPILQHNSTALQHPPSSVGDSSVEDDSDGSVDSGSGALIMPFSLRLCKSPLYLSKSTPSHFLNPGTFFQSSTLYCQKIHVSQIFVSGSCIFLVSTIQSPYSVIFL